MATGLGDNTIQLVDVKDGSTQATLRGHSNGVHSLVWLEAKGWLASGSGDATIRIWRKDFLTNIAVCCPVTLCRYPHGCIVRRCADGHAHVMSARDSTKHLIEGRATIGRSGRCWWRGGCLAYVF